MTELQTWSVKSPASNVSGKSAPEATPALQGATGAPLPSAMRKQMEEAFGASFKDVRVSVSGAASERGARAFAQGNQVTVAPKEWQPGSRATSRLIAHELAHVQQQRAGRVAGKGGAVNADGRLEAEADQAASRVLAGQDAGVSGGQGGASGASAPVQLKRKRRGARVGVKDFAPEAGGAVHDDPGLSLEPQSMSTKAAHAHFVSGLTSKPREQGHALKVAKMAAHVGAETATTRGSSLTTPHPESQMGDLRDMMWGAREQSGEFKDRITSLATDYSSGPDAGSVPPLKGLQRSAQKTDNDYQKNASRMKDFNRSTVFFDTTKDARAAAGKVRADALADGQQMDDSHYKDNFDKPAGDMNLSLPMRNGQRGEAQFHVKELKKYKDAIGHKLYEVDRGFKRDTDQKILNPEDQAFSTKIAELQQSHIAQRSTRQGPAVGDGGKWDDGELDAMKEHPTYQEALTRLHASEHAAAGAGAGAALDESEVYSEAGTRSIKKKIRAAEASFPG